MTKTATPKEQRLNPTKKYFFSFNAYSPQTESSQHSQMHFSPLLKINKQNQRNDANVSFLRELPTLHNTIVRWKSCYKRGYSHLTGAVVCCSHHQWLLHCSPVLGVTYSHQLSSGDIFSWPDPYFETYSSAVVILCL